MIKRVVSILLLVAMLGITGCRKSTVIPDDTLADIFHDAFVVNAYIGEERINLDSLQIYEPIFARYGYTAKDVVYTVGNFSRRKSARLGMVVEQAISRLERESKEYAKKVVILDTIRDVALRSLTRTVYSDTLIYVKKAADSTKLYIEIEPIHHGEYSISYNYGRDEDIDRYIRRAEFYFEDADGFKNGYTSSSLNRAGKVNKTLTSSNRYNHKLVLDLGKVVEEKKVSKNKKSSKRGKQNKKEKQPKGQNLKIRNLTVVYKPTANRAVDSLFKQYIDVRIFADGFLIEKDSLTLSPDSTRVSTPTTDNN